MDLRTTTLLADAKSSKGLFKRWRKDEDGGMIIFSLFLFVLILWFGGMAVDLMRFETTRAKLQGTLDRATLAAADLDQTLPPADVVVDYFTKAGMLEFLDGPAIVDQGINYRVVTANANAQMPLFFYDLPRVFSTPFTPGVSSLTVSGASTAEERVTDVEVSLILDVSGSMSRNSRIQNLRPAARDFVTTVLANNTNAPQGLITISMVPYSAVVNPGTFIEPHLNINRTHTYSTCPLFDDDTIFESTALDLTAAYDHVSHFDPDWYSSDPSPIGYPWCHVGDHNAIIAPTTDEDALHDAIDDLEPYGNTAIDMGMKWGVALLDPSTRSLITSLSATSGSLVPSIAAGRPEDHGLSDVLKIAVLMTDGSNTQQYDLYEPYKSGLSYVWFDLESPTQLIEDVSFNKLSIQYDGVDTPTDYWDDRFYHEKTGSPWRDYPDGYSSQQDYVNAMNAGEIVVRQVGFGPTYANDVRRTTWQELFATWEHNRINNTLLYNSYNNYAIPYRSSTAGAPDYVDPDNAINYSVVNSSEADDRLSDICQAARDEGIIIYTVAFEAPSGGQAALLDCASSPSHYFDVDGTDISDAFSSIASDIRALKLTQ